MQNSTNGIACAIALGIVLAGCSQQDQRSNHAPPAATAAAIDGGRFLLQHEPADGQDVIAVREQAKHDSEVTIIGRIGGSETPWIEGRAAFSIVDSSLKACSDIPGDTCETPWDYCCATDKLPGATALVKIVDDQGQLVNLDARKLLGVKELQTVVVTGKAQRDQAGNLTVLADGVYVKK